MIDIVCKYSNETAFFNRLMALGFSINEEATRQEDKIERVNTPVLEDINGDKYLTFRCMAEQADKLPNNDQNPAFACIYRTDQLDPENPEPWPEAEVQSYDIDGNPSGTHMQAVGRIQ